MGVYFRNSGSFSKTESFLNSLLRKDFLSILDKYGQMGVEALRAATPVDSGLAASSWDYKIERDGNTTSLIWTNDDIEGGCNVAVLVDQGHCSRSGSWVPGQHFIDSAIAPVMAELAREVAESL